MKTDIIRIIAAGLALGAIMTGCSTENIEPVENEKDRTPSEDVVLPAGEYELVASIGDITKTTLSDLTLSWESDDVIKVWTGEGFTDYVHQGEGKFKGELPVALNGDKFLALYPSAAVEGTAATFTIAQEQAFAVKAANDLPMVAVWGEDESCVFRPVCSIIEMPLTIADGVTLSTISYDFNGQVGAGEYTYDWSTGEYGTEGCGDITLTGTFATGNVYNAVAPGDYSDGFTLTLTDTDNCAMILTSKGGELAAGTVQPLGAVAYEQLAPEFTIAYDGWAATATLASTPGEGTQYWLSKTVNGEPLEGVAPVDMSSLAAGASVKLYGYLCSENVAAASVADGDVLYFVTKYVQGSKTYLRSVEYTYRPDPLEVVIYADDFHSMVQRSGNAASTIITSTRNNTAYTENVAFGNASAYLDFDAWGTFRMRLWSSGDYPSWDAQEAEGYCFEFYMNPSVAMNNNYLSFLVRFEERDGGTTTERRWSTKYLMDFNAGKTWVPANKWTKISIPMSKLQCDTSGDPKAKANSYKAVGTIEDYYGHDESGSLTKWCTNYKCITSIDLNNLLGDTSYTIIFDHFTIRKATL